MTSQQTQDPVRRWLDEAATAMDGDASTRRDALLELETSIDERIEERGGAEPDEAVVRDVLELMGDPIEVGGSMMPGEPLIAAHQTRRFLLNTAVVFAVHFLLVIGATLAGSAWELPPLRIQPIVDPKSFLELLACVFKTAVFDAGLVLFVMIALRRVERIVRVPRASLAERVEPRRCVQTAFFLALVLVVVNLFRNDLLALYLPADEGSHQVPLVGPGIVENLLLLNLWIGGAIARQLFYALLGERRLTLGLDLLVSVVGLYCLLRIVATKTLVDLSPAREALGPSADGIGALLNTVFVLLALVTAAMLAARAVRRGFRMAMLGG